jgi:ferredoxin
MEARSTAAISFAKLRLPAAHRSEAADEGLVDLDLCEGHAVCVRVAPVVFDLDEETGQSAVPVDKLAAPDLVEKALLAAQGCSRRSWSDRGRVESGGSAERADPLDQELEETLRVDVDPDLDVVRPVRHEPPIDHGPAVAVAGARLDDDIRP